MLEPVWSCHLAAAAAASQLQLHHSGLVLCQLFFLPSWLSSSLPFVVPRAEAGKSTGGKCLPPAADEQLSPALRVPPGSFNKHAQDGRSAMTLALAAAAALQSYWEVFKLNTIGQMLGAKQGKKRKRKEFSFYEKPVRGMFLSCLAADRGKGDGVSAWRSCLGHGHTALQEIRWLSHCFFFAVSSDTVHPSACENMLSLQGSKVPRATVCMQRWWCLVSVGSVWATACPILLKGQLDKTVMITKEVPQEHMEGN